MAGTQARERLAAGGPLFIACDSYLQLDGITILVFVEYVYKLDEKPSFGRPWGIVKKIPNHIKNSSIC